MINKTRLSTLVSAAVIAATSLTVVAQTPKPKPEEEVLPPMPPIQPRSPQETIKATHMQPGYRLELVLSEPDVNEPVIASYDGDGRIFVAEMRTYMQDADATGEHDPKSAVTLHWSSKRDNKYDKHSVFIDKLVLPRIMLALDKGRLLLGETDTNDLHIYTDTNGDGVADKKELFYEGGPRGGNMEHQPQGAVWGLDNWLYMTMNNYRLRWTKGGLALKQEIPGNGGQWGISQDDWGKMWYVQAGGEAGPVSFQTPIIYGGNYAKDEFEEGFKIVWPLVGLADVQGGTYRFRPEDGTLNHFTATCGSETYRGDRLPAELRGDHFFGEPVGRLVRRGKVTVKEGITQLSNPYQAEKSEFIRSEDPLFRVLNMNTAPDGTLHLVDMYRGIIQEGGWTRKGSYLRKKIDQYSLAKQTSRGRIYRVMHETTKLGPMPNMNSEKPAQLVAHLAHPNGWWRDMAQRLLVIKQDKSVVPALVTMAKTHKEPLARVHALWTLEGLNAVPADLVRQHLKDPNPKIRINALRVSEILFKQGDTTFNADIKAAAKDSDGDVALQSLMTANLLQLPEMQMSYAGLVARSSHRGMKEFGERIMNPPRRSYSSGNNPRPAEETAALKDGENTFTTLCATCHASNGKGLPMEGGKPGAMLAPSFVGSKTLASKDQAIKVLLHGLTGDIDGKKYEGLMIGMATNTNDWIANVLSYIRTSFGNGGMIKPDEVAKIREDHKSRTQPWTIEELRAAELTAKK